jgi:hypothetical protein
MERFLKTAQKGSLYTPDPREGGLKPQSEVYRLLYGSQALGYLELCAATGKQPYLREATERLEALLPLDDIWTNTAWDGDLAFAFLRAYEFTGRREFFDAGIAVARRLAEYCWPLAYEVCELNWGLSAALCLAEAYRLTGEYYFLMYARFILARTQVYQHNDGSLPHQSDLQAKNLAYSSWVAFQLMSYLTLDPEVTEASNITITYRGRIVTLDFDLMLSRLLSFLERQVAEDGKIFYTGGWKLDVRIDPECNYCSNPLFPMCKEYCEQLCGPGSGDPPCSCIDDPLQDCPIGKPTSRGVGLDGADLLCTYCSSQMYANCARACSTICDEPSQEFPCHCILNPGADCPKDSVWTEITYYTDWTLHYDTRGWTSELASTAVALARAGKHETKWKVLDFLFSLQNKDGSFPDKWGYKTEEPGTGLWLWASESHSVMRTSIVFRVLSSLLLTAQSSAPPAVVNSDQGKSLHFSASTPAIKDAFPNPSTGAVTFRVATPSSSERFKLAVIDIAGRVIRSFKDLPPRGGTFDVTWNGTDESNVPVAPGVYFAQVIGDGWRSTKKLVVLQR